MLGWALLMPPSVEAQGPAQRSGLLRLGTPAVREMTPLSSLAAREEKLVERLLEQSSARIALAVPMTDITTKRAALLSAESQADSALAVRGTVRALYWRTMARGLRADLEEGGEQMSLAAAVHDEARAILAIEPDHPGAHHVLGRLHGAVMRLGSFKRFLATRLLGGGSLGQASWESAEAHFRAALKQEPERVEHKVELAHVLLDTGETAEARELLEEVVDAPSCSEIAAFFQDKARAHLADLTAAR